MPELPEVETIRRALVPVMEGRRLDALDVLDPRWCLPLDPPQLRDAVEGRTLDRLWRRGKYLIASFDADAHLLMHLRMTGTMLVNPDEPQYRRVRFAFGDDEVWFCDPRRFGTGELALGEAALNAFLDARLGIEPLAGDGALTGRALRELARGRRGPIKPFLLDQRQIAGVGNIYADEALHRAGVHPLRAAGSLKPRQYDLLADAVVEALSAGLAAGGATIDDFRHPDGVSGAFQHDFLVHLREGEPCGRCGRTIVKMVVGGRGTYVCEGCQVRPRGASRAPRSGRPSASR